MNLIVPDEGKGGSGSGRMNYVKVIGKGEMGFRGEGKEAQAPDLRSLEEWARRYCEDQSSIKRSVTLGLLSSHFTLSTSISVRI